MRWFGGYVSTTAHGPRPNGARLLWDDPFPLWLLGRWAGHEVRTTHRDGVRIAVFGLCGAADISVFVNDCRAEVATAFPGSYTVVMADRAGLAVFTDLGGACPVYTASFQGGVMWGSSARALADLIGAGPDSRWLAAALADPAAPACRTRSAFTDVAAAAPGCRVTLRPNRGPRVEPMRLVHRHLPRRGGPTAAPCAQGRRGPTGGRGESAEQRSEWARFQFAVPAGGQGCPATRNRDRSDRTPCRGERRRGPRPCQHRRPACRRPDQACAVTPGR
jgi:hypothetical protein